MATAAAIGKRKVAVFSFSEHSKQRYIVLVDEVMAVPDEVSYLLVACIVFGAFVVMM